MAYQAKVYRILIASPSDVEEEREIAVRVIQEWNDLHSFQKKIVLLPLRWETHTAPEYGQRPQKIINEMIVDNCDLLLGIFWTRIGTPTGEADSGTIEEIQRVGKVNKSIMLYFSKNKVDPDKIDLEQMDKVREFQKNTYPNGLVEFYRTPIEFRDKLSRQLELKIRELHSRNTSGEHPVRFGVLDIEKDEIKDALRYKLPLDVKYNSESNKVEKEEIFYQPIPLILAIKNESNIGLTNLYIELDIVSDSEKIDITDTLTPSYYVTHVTEINLSQTQLDKDLQSKLAKYQFNKLQKINNSWKLSCELKALQPQRAIIIEPKLYIEVSGSSNVTVKSKIFADSFAQPYKKDINLTIDIG